MIRQLSLTPFIAILIVSLLPICALRAQSFAQITYKTARDKPAKYVYVVTESLLSAPDSIAQYSITADGSLAPLNPPIVHASSGASCAVADAADHLFFVGCDFTNEVWIFRIKPGGALTHAYTIRLPNNDDAQCLAVNARLRLLYVGCVGTENRIYSYHFLSCGSPISRSTSQFGDLDSDATDIAASSRDNSVYVVFGGVVTLDGYTGLVGQYYTDKLGHLRPMLLPYVNDNGAGFAAPTQIYLIQQLNLAYVNTGANVEAYSIAGDGSLTQCPKSTILPYDSHYRTQVFVDSKQHHFYLAQIGSLSTSTINPNGQLTYTIKQNMFVNGQVDNRPNAFGTQDKYVFGIDVLGMAFDTDDKYVYVIADDGSLSDRVYEYKVFGNGTLHAFVDEKDLPRTASDPTAIVLVSEPGT